MYSHVQTSYLRHHHQRQNCVYNQGYNAWFSPILLHPKTTNHYFLTQSNVATIKNPQDFAQRSRFWRKPEPTENAAIELSNKRRPVSIHRLHNWEEKPWNRINIFTSWNMSLLLPYRKQINYVIIPDMTLPPNYTRNLKTGPKMNTAQTK